MYATPFVPARDSEYFQSKVSVTEILESLETDLPRFLPGKILGEYRKYKYRDFILTVDQVTVSLLDQGLRDYLKMFEEKSTLKRLKLLPSLFFGYETNKRYLIATPEKALVDTLYYRGNLPVPDVLDLDRLDRGTLTETAKKFPASIFRKITLFLGSAADNASLSLKL